LLQLALDKQKDTITSFTTKTAPPINNSLSLAQLAAPKLRKMKGCMRGGLAGWYDEIA
jgi:hypothetical protein